MERVARYRMRRLCRWEAREVAQKEDAARAMSDERLRECTADYRSQIESGKEPLSLMTEAFATVREAARRALGLRLHDEQIMSGAAMAMLWIAEMAPHEGKTLACVLPAYLAALHGEGVHVIAADDDRAERAAGWTAPVYERLGMEVGLIRPDMSAEERRTAYRADVTYGGIGQLCLDLLRDDLADAPSQRVQRGLATAVVDDLEEMLINNAGRTWTLTAGPPQAYGQRAKSWARIAGALSKAGGDYTVEHASDSLRQVYDWGGRPVVRLSRHGTAKLRDLLGVDELRPVTHALLLDYLAETLVAREFGGEAPTLDSQTRAAITVVGYLEEYRTLTGTTACAVPVADLYRRCYARSVVDIPKRLPDLAVRSRRQDARAFEEAIRPLQTIDIQNRELRARRRQIVDGNAPPGQVLTMIKEFVASRLELLPASFDRDDFDITLDGIREVCPLSVTEEDLAGIGRPALRALVMSGAERAYLRRKRELGADALQDLERRTLAGAIGAEWGEFMAKMRAMPASLRLLGTTEDDLPAAYNGAAIEACVLMIEAITEQTIHRFFHFDIDDVDAASSSPSPHG